VRVSEPAVGKNRLVQIWQGWKSVERDSLNLKGLSFASNNATLRRQYGNVICDMPTHIWLQRAMQQSPTSRGVGISPIWALVWALIMFIIFVVAMAWSMSR